MRLSTKIKAATQDFQLLDHPFYQDWNQGKLPMDTLKTYAGQYFFHVDAFPRYISATHSRCENLEARKILLENLVEEDGLEAQAHIHLWANFCEALGHNKKALGKDTPFKSISQLKETFFRYAHSTYEEGLSSLYAYERQVPEIAETKIEGLKKFYNISNPESLAFFSVHQKADVFHREACEQLLDKIPEEKHEACITAARDSSKALWNFLTEAHNLNQVA